MKNKCQWAFGLFIVALLSGAASATAAVVSPAGYTSDFATQPPAEDWATLTFAGQATDTYDLDMDVNANITAGGVTAQTTSDPGNPPTQLGTATWSSTAFYLQTRPTGNRYTVLMGKFVNNTGTNATQVAVSYVLTSPGGGITEEADRGTRVYYSLTGQANDWMNLAALNNTISAAESSTVSASITLNWTNGASLYLVWADDNAMGNPTDSGNQIDNFSLNVTAGSPLTLACTLNAPAANAVLVSGTPITAAAAVSSGTPPYTVQYFTSSGAGNTEFALAGSSATPPYNVSLGSLPAGTYNLYAVVTDSAGSPASASSKTNTFFVADPIGVTLASPANDATFDHATSVTGSVMVSGGITPYSVQFLLNDLPDGAPVISPPYERNFGVLFVGDHAIRATVADASGWTSNSAISTIHITGPLAVTVKPTNGTSFVFGTPVMLTATPGGGTGPYSVALYTNDQAAGTLSSPPFAANLGILPVGSYASYARVTDSSLPAPEQVNSTTNVFTILANPLAVSLSSPGPGQSVTAGLTLPLTATATVGLPLAVSGVEFFYDGASVGMDGTLPYAASVSPAAGSHSVYAAATDSLGRKSYSATNQVTATAPSGNNNLFANAIPLFGPIVTTTGSNVGANKEGFGPPFGGEPNHAGNRGGASVWWTWTATASGPTTIDTMGSSFNTLLGVYTGSAVNQLTVIAGNDDYEGNTWSRVQFNAVAGTLYRIAVDGFRPGQFGGGPPAATGSIVLHVQGVGGLTITTPTNGMVFTLGDLIPVNVTIDADFPNPPATRVDFYLGSTLFASSAAAPFEAVASNVPAGTNGIYVVAIDSTGAPIQSGIVNVFVQRIGVTLVSPLEDTMFLNANPITVSAHAYLPSGSITNIEFFVDGATFGQAAAAPFSAVWSTVSGGSHRLTAVGKSDTGLSFNSQPVNIGVASSLVATGAVWKYLDNGSDQGTSWIAPGFDDSSWASGPAELGYGDTDEATVVEDNPTPGYTQNASDRYITTYFRRTFNVESTAGLAILAAVLERDDAGVVHLNGREIFRSPNLPAAPASITYLTVSTDGMGIEDTLDIFTVNPAELVAGPNVLAVEIHQQAPDSSDISFNFQLLGIPVIIHNLSPEIAITNLANNQFFIGPVPVPIQASASDADGTVARVDFYADGVKIGEDPDSDYSFEWANPPIGPHVLTAVAIDDQGASQSSEEVNITVYDAAGTPLARLTSPVEGSVIEGGTNLVVTAYADSPAGVASVQFFSNGGLIGESAVFPYGIVWDAPFGVNELSAVAIDTAGARGTSAVVTVTIVPNTIAPIVAGQTPLAGATVTNLTSLAVNFSEAVHGVDAADLLVNGAPATGLTGSGTMYTFSFPHPLYGAVAITWAGGHGITDFGFPSDLPFDALGAGAQWNYTLIDKTPPAIASKTPPAGSIITNLPQVAVTFTEAVTGVDAADLLINGVPALGVSGAGANYTFSVAPPAVGTVNITWAANPEIFDVAVEPNAFNRTGAGAVWSYTLDNRVVLVASNSNWRLLKGFAEASDPPSAWREPDFDASTWLNSPAPFFFGDPYTNATIQGTLLSDMQNNYTTIYLRQEFAVENRGAITNLVLNHQTDDGFVAWLNGVEVWRYNVPGGELPYTTNASAAAAEPGNAGAAYIPVILTNAAVSRLVNGVNVLAIQALNQNLVTSTDFGFNAQLYYFPVDPGTVPPRVVSVEPVAGDIYTLDEATFHFSEGVSGVKASDLLVNGAAAASVTSTTNSVYTFHFPQPAYGPVALTWDAGHTIADFDSTPRPFDGEAPASKVSYVLLNPSTPKILTRMPAPSTTLTGLTSVTITFDEPVQGVDAADFLVSGAAATSVTTSDSITYTFGFAQPAFGGVTIRWAAGHEIADLSDPPAPFYPTRFGHEWNYTLIDPVPSVTLTSPTNNTFFLPPVNITLRATATDNDGTVALVEFYESETKLGETNTAPYSLALSSLGLGTYTFRAVATDNIGLARTSAPVVINVVTSLPIALVRGPYLNSGSPTGGVVRWRTTPVSDGLVYYGTDLNNLTNAAQETSVTNNHIVQITGLEPDTKYYYSIGSAGYRLVGGTNDGANYWFKTSPPAGTRRPIRFWALGDAGTAGNGSPDRQRSTRDAFYDYAAATGQPDFWMMLGDNAYNSGTDTEHQAAVFDMYPATLRNKFLWPTLGNHETSMSTTATDFPYLHIFSLPVGGEAGGVPSGTEKYYSFDYGNIHFVCLDSMTSGRTSTSPMAQWLVNDLEATAQEWVVVFYHHSLYTKGTHDSDTEADLVELRENIIPLLEAHSVDLVLMGHSHVYERSYLLDGHYGRSNTFTESMKVDGGSGREEETGAYRKNDEGRGVIYTIAGSAGQALGGPLNHPAHFISLNELGTVVIDVDGGRLDAKFLNSAGLVRDTYTLLKPSPFPAAPQNLVALPASAAEINLAWTDAADNEAGYSVERSTDGINFTETATTAADATAALDACLSPNTTYYYRVRGTNSIGQGEYSNVASATTILPDSLPRAPVGLVASADDGVEFFRSQMVLRWQDNSTNEAAFLIERSGDGGSFTSIATVAANFTSFVDRHLESATLYYYRVRAVNALGQSAPSIIADDQTHPQTQLARAGEDVLFHGGAEGAPPVTYQWRFMDVPLLGQTNETLLVENVQASDEGDYTVAIRDANGRFVSNAAWLFVLSPPNIVAHPTDLIALAGTPVSLEGAADGTTPLTYQWRRNGAPLPGANSPTLSFPSVQISDSGGYDLVAENNFGAAISHLARLEVYMAPSLTPIPEVYAEVLKSLILSNVVADPNVPPLKLAYSLDPGAPTNAVISPTNGVFMWKPSRSQAPSTNVITVRVTDATRPLLSGSSTFTVYVNDYIEVTAGSAVLRASEANSVPLDVFSSAALHDLQCLLWFPHDLLADAWIEPLLPELASVSMHAAEANTVVLTFMAMPGQILQGSQRLARLHFTAVEGQASSFVPLDLGSMRAVMMAAGVEPTLLLTDGRAVVVGTQPLLEARILADSRRQLTLYGKTNTTYIIEANTNLVRGTGWRTRGSFPPSASPTQSIIVTQPQPPVYYRVRQQ